MLSVSQGRRITALRIKDSGNLLSSDKLITIENVVSDLAALLSFM